MRRLLKGDENMLGKSATISRKNEANSASINYIANNNGFTLNDLVSYDRKHNELNGQITGMARILISAGTVARKVRQERERLKN